MKIIPPGLSFRDALVRGYTGRVECRPYLDWLKTLPCATCGTVGSPFCPIDPSHLNGVKGMGTKSADLLSIPQCRKCHDRYELEAEWIPEDGFLALAAMYMLQAFWLGHLRFSAKPR